MPDFQVSVCLPPLKTVCGCITTVHKLLMQFENVDLTFLRGCNVVWSSMQLRLHCHVISLSFLWLPSSHLRKTSFEGKEKQASGC